MLDRDVIIQRAVHECLEEMYDKAQPSANYKELIEKENCQVEFVFSNSALDILKYTNNVLNCDIHTRYKTKRMINVIMKLTKK